MALENARIPSWSLSEQWITRARGKGKLGGSILVPIIPEKSWHLMGYNRRDVTDLICGLLLSSGCLRVRPMGVVIG